MPKGLEGFQKGNILWNNSNSIKSRFIKGFSPKNCFSETSYKKYQDGRKGHKHTKETKIKMRIAHSGEKAYNWKGGISKDANQWIKEKRHKLGISKRYRSELGISKTSEYKKIRRQKRQALERGGGDLDIKTIQIVYEDNIKKFGTLTCYLCEKPIDFKKDHLEHKIPLSRGGTNEYNNLAIACGKCNWKKHTKTETEYRRIFNHVSEICGA